MPPHTAIIWDERYLLHDMGPTHPESPQRLLAIKKVLEEPLWQGKLNFLKPRLATPEEIGLIHNFDYVKLVEKTAGQTVQLDPDVVTSPHSWEAARLAVGGVLQGVDWILQGEGSSCHPLRCRNSFIFVRPPGHHAEQARAMGFCIFNNIAIAAEYALRQPRIKKVLIIDFDVHHGNGTQWAFYERPDVFYISTHRYPFYPGTGAQREEGKGAGKGFTLNIPFPGGEGDEEYAKAFDQEIIPVARDYHPDLILVSAGYDAHRRDPLGGMNVSGEGYRHMSEQIVKLANSVCQGRVLFTLEGGYDLQGLAEGVRASLVVLSHTVGNQSAASSR